MIVKTDGVFAALEISVLPSGMEALPSCSSWMVKGSPIPSSRLNSGPPKQALKPARGEPRLHTHISYLSIIYPVYLPIYNLPYISMYLRI